MTRGGRRVFAQGAALSTLALVLASCSGSTDDHATRVDVDVSIQVCDGASCFTAPVPGAVVTLSGAGETPAQETDDRGIARFESVPSGTVTAQATWGSLKSGPAEVSVSSGGSADMSLAFSEIAKVP
jgi:hypothetical protein